MSAIPRPVLALTLAAIGLLLVIGGLAPDGFLPLLLPAFMLLGGSLVVWQEPEIAAWLQARRRSFAARRAPAGPARPMRIQRDTAPPPPASDAEILAAVYALTPAEFEHFSRNLLVEMGYRNVAVTGKTGDNGVDIVMRDGAGRLCIAQCKRYRGSVSPAVVRELLGVMTREQAAQGFLITTGRVSANAEAWAGNHQIKIIDAERLVFHIRRLRVTGDG